MDTDGILKKLAAEVSGELRSDQASCELYARDASLYRRDPRAVLRAGSTEDLISAVSACSEGEIPLTMRGAGTSLAGQAVGRGLVVDSSSLKTLTIDSERRIARVGPGVVLRDLNRAAAEHGLTFGPDVATADRATLGGMMANNSAGMRSVIHGLTSHHVRALSIVLADGQNARLARGSAAPLALESARALADHATGPRLLRRVSGYNLDALSGEEPDWPRLLCGSEGTLAVTLEAELDLVPLPEARGIALLSYASVEEAAAAVPDLLEASPSAIEMIDEHLLDPRNRPPADVDLLGFARGKPGAMLVVEHSGSATHVRERLKAIPNAEVIDDEALQERIWAARRLGIGRAQGALADREGGRDPRPIPFIEDPAVPPERLREFVVAGRRMLADEGVPAIWYGHASVGCLHIRPLMDLTRPAEVRRMRRLAEGMAEIVCAHDGSLSGEHGDGRARSELLGQMYPPATIRAFAELKARLDPKGILNPGVIVDPEPLDSGLEAAVRAPIGHEAAIDFGAEGGIARASTLCSRNGLCRSDVGAMCPSFQALGDERHSTRGRAMLFAAAIEGRLDGGLASPELHDALDLCLSCKACATECPAAVDMSRMKAEALAHRGPKVAERLAAATPHLLAAASLAPGAAGMVADRLGRRIGRKLPHPRPTWKPDGPVGDGPPIVVMSDTFTRHLAPEVGDAAVRVLGRAGRRVEVINPGCCGRTALSAGRIDTARSRLRRTVAALAPSARAGAPIVALEPSCWSMLVDDAAHLLPADPVAEMVAAACTTFEGAVRDLGIPGPEEESVVHVHCHARALGAGTDAVTACGPAARDTAAGCCGMAGSFGYQNPELSRQIFAKGLGAVLDSTAAPVVASGISCRHQINELGGRPVQHPAEHLANADPA